MSAPAARQEHLASRTAGSTASDPETTPAISLMRRRHLGSVLRIEAGSEHQPWSLGLFMNELAMPSTRRYLVAKVRSEVVGYAGMMFVGPDGHLTTITTHPDWRRHHVATHLLADLAHAARDRRCENLTLEVRSTNHEAIALYTKFGFAPAGLRKNYYSALGEDALVMWAHDIGSDEYASRLERIVERGGAS
jgi:ribosomal-protein-alanine N-acetyltransferase